MKHENEDRNYKNFYQEEELLPENPQIVSFFFELTPSESSCKNPWKDTNDTSKDEEKSCQWWWC